MEWGRVKSIMIGVFCIINIFLLITYLGTMRTSPNISEETISNTVAILDGNNVAVNADNIPRKIQDIRIFDVINKYETHSDAVKAFWQTSQSEGLDYFNPEHTIADGYSFEYKSSGGQPMNSLDIKSAEAHAKKIIALLGLNPGMTLECFSKQEEGIIEVTFYPVYEGSRVLDTCLVFDIGSMGVTRVYGRNWLCDEIKGGGISHVRPVTEILVAFAVGEERTNTIEITDIRLGYFIGGRDNEKSTVTVVPVWSITTDNGGYFYYDARNGDLL